LSGVPYICKLGKDMKKFKQLQQVFKTFGVATVPPALIVLCHRFSG
jgi:hypothetical protein